MTPWICTGARIEREPSLGEDSHAAEARTVVGEELFSRYRAAALSSEIAVGLFHTPR
jgi:hypothetical protein